MKHFAQVLIGDVHLSLDFAFSAGSEMYTKDSPLSQHRTHWSFKEMSTSLLVLSLESVVYFVNESVHEFNGCRPSIALLLFCRHSYKIPFYDSIVFCRQQFLQTKNFLRLR